jgi:monovalent cation:H+ antiporter-2, CPA2 family
MGIESDLFTDIVIVFIAAFAGGWAARLLRLPTLLGYLAAGVVLGPHAFALISNVEAVQTLAELGVVLLLFAVGVEISPGDVLRLGPRVVLAGLGQLLGTGAAGFVLGLALGWEFEQAILLSFVISLSSTMVVLKSLTDRGELQTIHGRVMTGMLVIQDLAFVPMIAIVPALAGNGGSLLQDIAVGGLKAAVVLAFVFIAGGRIIPWLLRRAAGFGTQESFIVTVVAITVAAAAATQSAGLSAALGAFGAGLTISVSDWTGHRALQEVMPLRDIFAAMFFASLGMLLNPEFLTDNLGLVTIVVVASVLLKLGVVSGMVRLVGYLPRTAILAGVGMVQIGEFSFILAGTAEIEGIVDETFFPLVVVAAVATMAITPGAISASTAAIHRLELRWPSLRAYLPGRAAAANSEDRAPRYREHVVVAGLGRVGSFIAEELHRQSIPFIAVDVDPAAVARVRTRWGYAIHGDSASPQVLDSARVKFARLLVVAQPDPVTASVTVQHAQAINSSIHIVARVGWRAEAESLRESGVDAVVWPEMEAALEMLRVSLVELGVGSGRVSSLVDSARQTLEFGDATSDEGDPYAGMW